MAAFPVFILRVDMDDSLFGRKRPPLSNRNMDDGHALLDGVPLEDRELLRRAGRMAQQRRRDARRRRQRRRWMTRLAAWTGLGLLALLARLWWLSGRNMGPTQRIA